MRSMRSTPTGGRPLPAFGYTGSIRAHSSRHGTTRSISARNCARRVVFAYFSKPVPASVICLRAIITSRGRPLPVSSQHVGLKRERVIQRFLKDELGRRAGLVPSGIVVIPRSLVETQLHVVVRSNELARVDDPSLEGGIDLTGRQRDDCRTRPGHDPAAEARDANLESLVDGDRRDLIPEPTAHLRAIL